MWTRLKSLLRVTAVRLSIAYTLAFGLLAVILVFYMTGSAVDYLRQQFQTSINQEITSLRNIYNNRGLNALVRVMEVRARAPGANLYVISDPAGSIIAGNVRDIDVDLLRETGWHLHPFEYEGFDGDQGSANRNIRERRAVARSFELPNGMRILVGEDIGEPERLRGVVRKALSFSLGMMLLVGFLIWYFVGSRALKRIDMVSKSTERILAGDQSERLPVSGVNDEFDRLSKRMNIMLDRISLLDKGLRNVSDSIAHDLKTPLTRLRNKADAAINADHKDSKSRDALAEVISDSDQLIKTFNALLMISRVEAGSQIAELAALDMSALMEDVAELYEPVCEEEGFELVMKIESDVEILGNRELLSQALTNLLDNALKYGATKNKADQKVIISLRCTSNEVIACVSDKGPGIAASEYEKVKERFTRLDESRSLPGNGLGLALVDAIAKLHGGRFELGDAAPGLKAELVFPSLQ
jgi:signal transduction histidine kinase